ncbi:hypothetical protein [Paenibacillus alvei]|uniref:hypothetical protein n=1 Tax=Paenibacillus alvei TaxID=44250 RepID=UPI00227E258C|nr:hypothetical protein [Paenibacillus alvei]MCY7484412.1 hypothetical protein [Paenibacillus alvei]
MSKRLTEEARSKWAGIPQLLKSRCGTGAAFLDTEDLRALVESEKAGWEEVERINIESQGWEDEYKALKRRYEELERSALETLELLKDASSKLQDAHNALIDLDKWYNDGVCTWEPHCPAELATIWRRAASVRQRIQEGIRCGTDN